MAGVLTVGHGTLDADAFAALVRSVGVELLVDVRSYPGSRRHPHFARELMERWLPGTGVAYRWEKALGGFRTPRPGSANLALRHSGFRGYADHMRSPEFSVALDRLVTEASATKVAVMCSETLWWRCHRRLLADALVLSRDATVCHLAHDGRCEPHHLTDGARQGDDGLPVYDVGASPRLL